MVIQTMKTNNKKALLMAGINETIHGLGKLAA